MAKVQHMALKAAVKKYLPLHVEGKSEEEVKEEIMNDPKNFDEDAVEEIYQAIVNFSDGDEKENPGTGNENKESGSPKIYKVVSPFRDKDNFSKEYKVGHDVSHFDEERLEKLVANGHVEISSELSSDDDDE